MINYVLATFVFLANGQVAINKMDAADLNVCFQLARRFVSQKAADLGGVALGAGCVVKPPGA